MRTLVFVNDFYILLWSEECGIVSLLWITKSGVTSNCRLFRQDFELFIEPASLLRLSKMLKCSYNVIYIIMYWSHRLLYIIFIFSILTILQRRVFWRLIMQEHRWTLLANICDIYCIHFVFKLLFITKRKRGGEYTCVFLYSCPGSVYTILIIN